MIDCLHLIQQKETKQWLDCSAVPLYENVSSLRGEMRNLAALTSITEKGFMYDWCAT